jgi:hypothetical protein
MNQLIMRLEQEAAASPGALVVVYFAGHGVTAQGHNLLLPVNVALSSSAADTTDATSAVSIAERLRRARVGLTIMFLDDCRASGSGEPASFAAETLPDNTFIGYSAKLGGIASDENSAYAEALAGLIGRGFQDLMELHLAVAVSVASSSLWQSPVASTGPNMPSQSMQFYPIGRVPNTRRDTSQAYLDPNLARTCDVLSRWLEMSQKLQRWGASRAVPDVVDACKKAWAVG